MMKIEDFQASDKDTLEEKIKQNEEAVKVSTSSNAVNVVGREVDVDGKCLDEENLEKINSELLDQDVAEGNLYELKKVDMRCAKAKTSSFGH